MGRLIFALIAFLLIGGAAFAVWWFYDPEIVLDYEKQVLIWDAESATFQIETHFGKERFLPALKSDDREALAACFQDGFTAKLLNDDQPKVRQVSSVQERMMQRGTSTQTETDAAGLQDWLLQQLEPFEKINSASQRVLEIHPVVRTEDDTGTWKIRFLHMFYGTTADGGTIAHESEHDVVLEYLKRDDLKTEPVLISWDTIYVKNARSTHPLMEEATEAFGLNLPPSDIEDNWEIPTEQNLQQKLSAAVEDYDKDGYLDIAVASLSQARGQGLPVLLRNIEGKRFENVTRSMGITPWDSSIMNPQFTAIWIDYDNDSWPDLIFGERLYRNEQGRRFTDVSKDSRLKFLREPMGMTVADYNNDGYADLYILYQSPSDMGERQEASNKAKPWIGDNQNGEVNHLWVNNGNGTFRQATNANATAGKGSTFAATWFHLDDDMYPDVYVVNDFGDNVLLRNKGDGTFEDLTDKSQTGGFATSMGVASGDINNDGTAELYVGNMYSKMGRRIIAHVSPDDYPEGVFRQLEGACAGNRMYSRKPGDTLFTEHSVEMGINAVGWGFAPTFIDFDGDGFLDIYANAGFVSFSPVRPDG